jgi:hypothetical protein
MPAAELPIPTVVEADPRAVELLRVWIAQRQQHVAIATHIWKDPAAWGIMLVDLAKHIARAYEQSSGQDYDDVLKRIQDGFDAEWQHDTNSR